MKPLFYLILLAFFSMNQAQEPPLSIEWKGQASLFHAGAFQGSFSESPTTLRYIPQFRVDYQITQRKRLGFDGAIDLYNHSLGDSLTRMDGDLYRFTIRYDLPKTQLRLGLQKIN
ncbi:MAG: hypothetical protein HQ508_02585, partial [Candidatus Marinimicrobia bacterium]|nr:hypothetical protein [Candidatus Neomarinimicrobiota bacterium]